MKTGFIAITTIAVIAATLILGACGESVDVDRVLAEAQTNTTAPPPPPPPPPPVGCTFTAGTPLTTTMVGGNSNNGTMFSIVAGAQEVRIDSFEVNDPDASSTPSDWEIYQIFGSYMGFEGNSAAWTLVGSATGVPSAGPGVGTPLPITLNVTIPAGQTTSFYVTRTDGLFVNYTNGVVEGGVLATDGSIDVLEGIGNSYPFGGIFSPRDFNGIVHYSTCV